MDKDVEQAPEVRRRCKDCGRRNVVSASQLGTRCRCAECGALLYPEEAPGYVPRSEPTSAPRREEPAGERAQVVVAASGGGFRFLIGLLLVGAAWGYLGGQQAKQPGYDCEVGVGDVCWAWKRSTLGKLADELRK